VIESGALASETLSAMRAKLHDLIDRLDDDILQPALHAAIDTLRDDAVPGALRRMLHERAPHARATLEARSASPERRSPREPI
jgi:hypothetical protein